MPHRIYFAQHGLAIDKSEDPERPLSADGTRQTNVMANALQNFEIPVSGIFHSGKLRAAQTADIFTEVLNISISKQINGLAPNDDVTVLTPLLSQNNTLYIGHLPHLEKMLTYLITGKNGNPVIKFKNSAVACLQKNDDLFQLQWYLTPELVNNHFR